MSITRRCLSLVLVATGLLAASACGAAEPSGPAALATQGRPVAEVIDQLDRTNSDRDGSKRVSVQQQAVVISENGREKERLAMPVDKTYLAIAPYVSRTHECFNHNLTTCQGELTRKTFKVLIKDDAGTVLVDRDATTYENGFVGFWLPRGIKGTVTFTGDGGTGTVPFGTGADDATCLTTLRLA